MASVRKAKYGSFQDIIDTTASEKNDSIFNNYKPKGEIGKEIFKELYKRFNNDPAQGAIGFYMDDTKAIGLLSQCQSLQALLLLASDFGLTFDDKRIVSDDEDNLTIREIMDIVIEDIFKRIKTKEDHVYRFDASPYETKLFTVERSNIEAITWVIPCFLQALKYHATIGETCKWEEQLVDVISYGLRYINDSFIDGESELGKSNKLEIGWNFSKKCEEPSLYYTFTVCECFVEFFTTFEDYLTYKEAERIHKTYPAKNIPKQLRIAKEEHDKEYERLKAAGDRGYDPDTGKKLAQFDEYNELFLRYKEINNGIADIDGSIYGELEEKCKMVAREIWRLSKEHLADDFYYNDLSTTLTEAEISISTTSDALFNTVYIINIMLDAGMDEELELLRSVATTQDEAFELEQEYNNLLESCQLASQKALRTYEKLKNVGKEYIVEQFLVGFNENFTFHKDIVRELRKRRMRVFTLIPLLIRTNNAISEYLIKYPQVNMKKYLGYILDNRFVEKNKAKWIWENDGFFSASNYYYVSALGEFYAYYERYESEYIENYNQNEAQRKAIIEKRDEQLKAPTGEIGVLKRKLQDKEKEIERLKKEKESIDTPVENAVSLIVSREMSKLLPEMLCSFIESCSAGLTVSDIDDTPCTEEHKHFSNAVSQFMFALMSKYIYDTVRSTKLSKSENKENHEVLRANVQKELIRCLRSYIAEISNSDEDRSSFYNQN